MASWVPCESATGGRTGTGLRKWLRHWGHGDYICVIRECSLWILIRCSLPPEVLRLRTAERKWNTATLNGKFAALWFFPMMNKDDTPSAQLLEWQSLRFDYCDTFGFALRAIEPGEWSDWYAFGWTGKRTWEGMGPGGAQSNCSHNHINDVCLSEGLVHGGQLSVRSAVGGLFACPCAPGIWAVLAPAQQCMRHAYCLISVLKGTCEQGFCDEFPISCAESGRASTRNEWFRYLLHIFCWGKLWVSRAQLVESHACTSVSLWSWRCVGGTPRRSWHEKNRTLVPLFFGCIVR